MLRLQGSKIIHPICAIIFVLFLTVPIQAQYSGGTGEPNNPYQIATAEDLIALGNEPNDYDKHFIMTADIDLAGYVFKKAVIDTLSGAFNGNFHTISNMNIQSSFSSAGLFGIIEFGEIRNLGMIDVNIPSGSLSGSLVGANRGTIINCYSTGSVYGRGNVGGIAGANYGSIAICYSACIITGKRSRATIGGLVGYNEGEISDSYSKGIVFGTSNIGKVNIAGGFVGNNSFGSINRCYSTGQVSGYYLSAGGLIGRCIDVNNVNSSFWDIQTSGQTTSEGGTGATTNQMQDPNIFRSAGWDFAGPNDGINDIWTIPEAGGYPILWWQSEAPGPLPVFSGGSGTENDPYLIATVNDINNIGSNPRLMEKHFKVVRDISLENEQFYSIGLYCRFNGIFNGNGHIISNLKVSSVDQFHNTCLFDEIGHSGLIKNIGIDDVNIIANSDYAGALAGINYGTIINSYSTGNIYSEIKGGGLVGINFGAIENCYSQANVTGSGYNGGLVGEFSGYYDSITNCYASGYISGPNSGGLIGIATYRKPNVFASFWDIEKSGLVSNSFRAIGKTTAEMQTKSTFINEGWDFIGETTNGTEEIWWIDEGKDYPRLWWENLLVIDFDKVEAPCLFADTVQLTSEYAHMGVTFQGPSDINGAAILNECGSFGVYGHSSPNFLAFNNTSTLLDGGKPRNPETILFDMPVSIVTISVGHRLKQNDNDVLLEAFDASDNLLDSDTISMTNQMQTLKVSSPGIVKVVISTNADVMAVDDIKFLPEQFELLEMPDISIESTEQKKVLKCNSPNVINGEIIQEQE